jgi:hypothetical protein
MRRQCLITMLLMSLSLLFGGSVLLPVEAAAPCHTKDGAAKDGAIVAPSLAGLKNALSIMGSGDTVALRKLMEQKRAMRVPAGMPVFIEESFESFRRIRLEGTIESVWTHGYYITCRK